MSSGRADWARLYGVPDFYLSREWDDLRHRYVRENGPLVCFVCGPVFPPRSRLAGRPRPRRSCQLHHRIYDRFGGNEHLSDLVPLCDIHHAEVHAMVPPWQLYDAHVMYRDLIYAEGLTAATYRLRGDSTLPF